jgi:hypothetical protein
LFDTIAADRRDRSFKREVIVARAPSSHAIYETKFIANI